MQLHSEGKNRVCGGVGGCRKRLDHRLPPQNETSAPTSPTPCRMTLKHTRTQPDARTCTRARIFIPTNE